VHRRHPHLAAFISAHGFGHAVRTAQVISRIPPAVGVTVFSRTPEAFLRAQITRPFDLVAAAFDCGTLHRPGQIEIDPQLTLARYLEVSRANRAAADSQLADLRRRGVTAIVADTPAFPLMLARQLAIPGLVIANFTWYEIYTPLVRDLPEGPAALAELAAQYRQASLALITPLDIPMGLFTRPRRVPLIARHGRRRPGDLRAAAGVPPDTHTFLLYAGNVPLPPQLWRRLAELPDTLFLCFDGQQPPPGQPNVQTVSTLDFPVRDLVPSVSAVVAKAGYGITSECMAAGTPLLYLHRNDFAESEAIAQAIAQWGGGIELPVTALQRLELAPYLERVLSMPHPRRLPASGDEVCAQILTECAAGAATP